MEEIKCPRCGEVFKVDESSYAAILNQIKNKEFEKEKNAQIAIELQKIENDYSLKLQEKVSEIEKLEHKLELQEKEAYSKIEIALQEKDKKIELLNYQLEEQQKEIQNKIEKSSWEKEQKIAELNNQLKQQESKAHLDKKIALQEKENEITILKGKIDTDEKQYQINEKRLEDHYEELLKHKEDEIQRLKDYKAQLSTKLIGESLEEHCKNEFEKMRPMGFQDAYFEKDNDIKTGSKGDFIYRDFDENGEEYISIMFEMKNESETTATKKKNQDFFKELDKDRNEKGCEYAVLVSLLESDNELYNTGIVDVSHRYPKMYVVRPQFFMPIISLLRNAAKNSMGYKKQLDTIKKQEIDITNFEKEMNDFKNKFGRNFELADRKFREAIDEIDKTINHLEKTKEALLSSNNNLRLANKKLQDISIKKLTKNSPTMAKKLAEISDGGEEMGYFDFEWEEIFEDDDIV